MTTREQKALDAALTAGWEEDTSPDTEMSNKNWYRWDACTPPVTQETLIERYWDSTNEKANQGNNENKNTQQQP